MDYKDFFSFTRQERRGIITFLILCSFTVAAFRLWPYDKPQPPQAIFDYHIDTIQIGDQDTIESKDMSDLWADSGEKIIKKQKFAFNPNNISYDSLQLLGFSRFGAKSLINYVSKGGIIYSAEKFKTIYGIDQILVDELEGMIVYPEKTAKSYENIAKQESYKPKDEKQLKIVELNSADSIDIVSIRGIGPSTAFKILQMRKKTGGFINLDQLVELNIMKDSMFQNIKHAISLNPENIKKININTADYKTFVTHPYFNSATANAILKYRNQHGPFSDVKHISRIRSLKEEVGIKILPYLDTKSQ